MVERLRRKLLILLEGIAGAGPGGPLEVVAAHEAIELGLLLQES
ncbi:MAG TPA: hypothetical protein VGM84_08940 [Steroidobacteraceae bacterium]